MHVIKHFLISILLICTSRGNDFSDTNHEVYIGYQNTPRCHTYLQSRFADLNPDSSGVHNKSLSIQSIRTLMLPIIAGGGEDKNAENFRKDGRDTVRYSFYDQTSLRFSCRTDLLSDPGQDVADEDMVGEIQWLKFVGIDRLTLPDAISTSLYADALSRHDCVKFVEQNVFRNVSPVDSSAVDHVVDILKQTQDWSDSLDLDPELIPNDPYFLSYQWYQRNMNSPSAWDVWTGPLKNASASNAVIGVTDTGCDINHPDLKGHFWKNPGEICNNGIDDDHNGYVDDCYGWNFYSRNSDLSEELFHGTSVSGSITAGTNNSIGISGTCWSCKLMCLKVGRMTLSIGAFAEAVNYAKGWGVRTINFSAGGGASSIEQHTIETAERSDILFVVAAGNAGCDLDSSESCAETGYPARYQDPNILSVGATDSTDRMTPFSNYGSQSVSLFAPGQNIYLTSSTARSSTPYKSTSGTSFSSPLTAGIVGLMRSKHPELTYRELVQCIISSCRKVAELTGLARCPGVVDARAALDCAAEAESRIWSRTTTGPESAIEPSSFWPLTLKAASAQTECTAGSCNGFENKPDVVEA